MMMGRCPVAGWLENGGGFGIGEAGGMVRGLLMPRLRMPVR
jgi:hypothetical protein